MWLLRLNPMQCRMEASEIVAWSEEKQGLESLLAREHAEPYREGQWYKVFRKGGPLEWFNPPEGSRGPVFQDLGSLEEHLQRVVERATAEWASLREEFPQV
jgi:hypothetical protein